MGGSNRRVIDRVAYQRIGILYRKALENVTSNPGLSKAYVSAMKRISTHYRQSLPQTIKDRICNGCGNVLVPGSNCSVRLCSSEGFIAVRCDCGREKHVFYKNGKR